MSVNKQKETKNENEETETKDNTNTQTNHKKKLNKGPYILGESLGEGAFAKVRLATQIHIKEKCAIKIVDKRFLENVQDIQRLRKEIKILKKIRHKNIIQLYDIMESKTNLYFVMEYCKGGELFDYIVKKKRLTEKEACVFFHQIINGVEYLHNQGIIHRDLKPENLLLDEKNQIKISDFGLSTFYTKDNFLQTACGTPSYAPPEMLEGLQYNGEASDIWSCGIILYAMLCGSLPFSESKEDIIVEKIKKHDYKIPDYLSNEAQDILNHILKINPEERFNIESIKKHPWFNIVEPHLIKGISVESIKIPVDDKILDMVKNFGFNPEECKELLLKNKFCSLTSIYYLCLKKYIKEGGKSISDLESDLFEEYINDPNNYINNNENKTEDEEKKENLEEKKNSNNSIDEKKKEKNDINENEDKRKDLDKNIVDGKNNFNEKKEEKMDDIKEKKKSHEKICTNNLNKSKNDYNNKNYETEKKVKEKTSNNSKRKQYNNHNNKSEIKNKLDDKKKDKLNINLKSNDIIIIRKYIKANSYSTDKKVLNNNNNNNDKLLIEKYKEKQKELDNIRVEENNTNANIIENLKKAKKETSLRNNKNKIGKNIENNKFINLKEKKNIKKNSQNKENLEKEENNKIKKQNKKNRNNLSLYNIQNKIFPYENHITTKKINQNEFSYKTINDNNSKTKNKINESNLNKNKKDITKKNDGSSPNKKNVIKKYDKNINGNGSGNNSSNANTNIANSNVASSENHFDKTFTQSYNNKDIILNSEMNTKELYENYKKSLKEGNYEIKNKSSPFPLGQYNYNKYDDIKLLETEKPLNVINYIAKKLVTSSFCGNLNLEFKNRNSKTKRIDNYEKPLISNWNILTNKENKENKESKDMKSKENNKSIDNLFNNDGNFKNLISVLNQKFKNYLSKENSKNAINYTQKNRSLKNNKYIFNDLDYNNFILDDIKSLKSDLTPTQKSEFKIDFLSNTNNMNKRNNTNNDAYSYNINNMTSHYNNCLDISTNYDPGLDSKGESSVDKALTINKKELRNYSISLDKKNMKKNVNIMNLDYLRNNGGVNTSHNKYSKNINVISEDDELMEFNKEKDSNNSIKYIANKNKYVLTDKKVSINLISNFNCVTNSDIKKNK